MAKIARVPALGLLPILAKGLREGSNPSSQMKNMQLTKEPARKPKIQISMMSWDFLQNYSKDRASIVDGDLEMSPMQWAIDF